MPSRPVRSRQLLTLRMVVIASGIDVPVERVGDRFDPDLEYLGPSFGPYGHKDSSSEGHENVTSRTKNIP
jgi:hypothetical protein